jgi:hypothetical protein
VSTEEITPEPPDDSEDRSLPELSSRSGQLMGILTRQKGRADHFYEGALRALADRSNRVRAESAAYCLRELIEELERAALAPTSGPKLGDLFKRFRTAWERADPRLDDRVLDNRSDPAILAVERFLNEADAGYLSRRDRAQTALTELDPVGRERPRDAREQQISALLGFRDEFDHVLHGPEPTEPLAFAATVESFEAFLLAWFAPRTFDDFSEIDELLEEGPPT